MSPAIAELERTIEFVETNIPINEREGNHEQAELERAVAADCRTAIAKLSPQLS